MDRCRADRRCPTDETDINLGRLVEEILLLIDGHDLVQISFAASFNRGRHTGIHKGFSPWEI
jgi:hypothetical protein